MCSIKSTITGAFIQVPSSLLENNWFANVCPIMDFNQLNNSETATVIKRTTQNISCLWTFRLFLFHLFTANIWNFVFPMPLISNGSWIIVNAIVNVNSCVSSHLTYSVITTVCLLLISPSSSVCLHPSPINFHLFSFLTLFPAFLLSPLFLLRLFPPVSLPRTSPPTLMNTSASFFLWNYVRPT